MSDAQPTPRMKMRDPKPSWLGDGLFRSAWRFVRWNSAPFTVAAILALSLCSSVTAAAPKTDAASAQRLAAEGKQRYLARDYQTAADRYAAALQRLAHPALFFAQARCLEQLGRFGQAASAYQRAEAASNATEEKSVVRARGAANGKLAEAQAEFDRGAAAAALPIASAGHRVLYAQAKRADDGGIYPEPAAALLLLARLELAAGSRDAALQLLADIRGDPTAPDAVVGDAQTLAKAAVARPAEPARTPAPPPPPSPPASDAAEPSPPPSVRPPVAAQPAQDRPTADPPGPVKLPAAPATAPVAAPAPRHTFAQAALAVAGVAGLGLGVGWNIDYQTRDPYRRPPAEKTASISAYAAGGTLLVGAVIWWLLER
ncbi:MAG: hypothetical protein HY902_18580 [Deltaproteobacteria bacterium]|nr:hypothetical protein [Deltaproteobacteria bacterium]